MNGTTKRVDVALVDPNPWNPNRMVESEQKATEQSLARFGQVAPVVVRTHPDDPARYQIIDGAHRREAMALASAEEMLVFDLGEVSDTDAKHLNMVLVETRGQPDEIRMGALLASLSETMPPADIVEPLPMTADEATEMIDKSLYDWQDELAAAQPPKEPDAFGPFAVPAADAQRVKKVLASFGSASDGDGAFYRAVTEGVKRLLTR